MARHGIYSVFDSKVSAYSNPFYAVNDAVASRCVRGAVRDPNTALAQNPADFSVYALGVFDDVSGLVEPTVPPRFVAAVSALSVGLEIIKPEVSNG